MYCDENRLKMLLYKFKKKYIFEPYEKNTDIDIFLFVIFIEINIYLFIGILFQ